MQILRNFAVFEGGDGSGTSTQLHLLENKLAAMQFPFYVTSEPTDGIIGQLIRRALKKEFVLQPQTMARLFAADRGEHLYARNGIVERCMQGNLVACDRYILSSLAYQGIECGEELPGALNSAFPLPYLLIFFDLDPETAIKRIEGRPSLDIYEHIEFQEKVRKLYHAKLQEFKEAGVRIAIVDASQNMEKVFAEVWRYVSDMPIFKK